jgi:hypothetical protein
MVAQQEAKANKVGAMVAKQNKHKIMVEQQKRSRNTGANK